MKVFGVTNFLPIRLVTAAANCLVYGLTNQSVTLKKWTFQAHCKHNCGLFIGCDPSKNVGMISVPAPFLTMSLCGPGARRSSHLRQAGAPIQAGAWLICNGNFSALLWLSYNGAAIQAVNKIHPTQSHCEPWTDSNELSNNYQVASVQNIQIFWVGNWIKK